MPPASTASSSSASPPLTSPSLAGGCTCNAVRFTVQGDPLRVGVCHCTSCRKETGSVLMAYAVWDTAGFETTGETRTWEGRDFCPRCGTRLFALRADEHEVEVKLGALDDAPTHLVPTVELWVKRREPWLAPLAGAAQHREDPPGGEAGAPGREPPPAPAPAPMPAGGNEGAPVGTGTPLGSHHRTPSSGQGGAKKG